MFGKNQSISTGQNFATNIKHEDLVPSSSVINHCLSGISSYPLTRFGHHLSEGFYVHLHKMEEKDIFNL